MKSHLPALLVIMACSFYAKAQFVPEGRKIVGSTAMPAPAKVSSRSATKPTSCKSDTTTFPRWYTTGYRGVTIKKGSSLGQYFPVPSPMSVSGFYFYAWSGATTPARPVYIRLICNVYKAGADSLPSGGPLGSDTVTVDTVMGSTIYLSRIMRKAVFKNPVSFSNGGYIITVECDSSSVSAAMITNDWTNKDGQRMNLGCGSVSGKWYRCLNLNIGGVTFDANMQMYPFVKYNFGTDFSIDNNCYQNLDTVRFTNASKNNVCGSIVYNFYIYYGLEIYSHRWTFDGISSQYAINAKYKPTAKKNFKTQLISTVYMYSSGQCYDTMERMVYFRPSTPSPKKPPMACRGDTVNIDVTSDAGAIVKWYKKASDTIPFYTGTSLKINNAQKNDTFYLQSFNGPCKSSMIKIEFVVNDYPNDPVVKHDSICSGATANLSASSNKGNIEWFSDLYGNKSFYTGNIYQTGKLSTDTWFYVQANNNGCLNKSGRVKVQAYVGSAFAPDKPWVVADTFTCYRPVKNFSLSASQNGSDTLRWFNTPTGGKPLGTGNTFSFTPSGRGDVSYYVETWNGICGSGRSQATIHVYDYSILYGVTGDTICSGENAYPHLSVPYGTVNWYAAKSDQTPVYSGKTPTFAGLTKNKWYYLEAEENGCKNASRDSLLVIVNAPPVPVSVKADAVCAKGLGSMNVTLSAGKVNWFYDSSDLTPFYTGSTVNTGMLLSNVTYYYQTENKGCFSAKTPLTITIKPRPVAGFTWNLVWQRKLVCTPITTSGVTLFWDWGDTKTQTGAPFNHTYTAEGNYTVRLVATSTTNGCKDTADIPVIVSHVDVNTIKAGALRVYPVPVQQGSILHLADIPLQNLSAAFYAGDGRRIDVSVLPDGSIRIPDDLSAGIYWLQVLQGTQTWKVGITVTE